MSLRQSGLTNIYIPWDNTIVDFTKPTLTITAFQNRRVARSRCCHPPDQLFKLFSNCATNLSRPILGERCSSGSSSVTTLAQGVLIG